MTDISKQAVELPHDEPRQIVCTGQPGSNVWNPAFGTWEVDEFGIDSDEPSGEGERLFVNRRLYDALSARVAELEAATHGLVFASKDMAVGINCHNSRHDPKIEGAVPTLFYKAIYEAEQALKQEQSQ